jgi:hypothetical protein
MPDQTPAPDYVPRPTGSSAGVAIAIVAAILLLVVVCGLGLLGVGWLAYSAVEVPQPAQQPPPMIVPAPEVAPVSVEPGSQQEQKPEPDAPQPQ